MEGGHRLASRGALLAAAGSLLLLFMVLIAGAGSGGCQTPTQVTVELRTFGALPCTALKGVAIVVARTPGEAEDRMKLQSFSAQVSRGECNADGRTIGTLVVTPSEATGAIVVRARFSDAPDATCEPPTYKGCIVARRTFSFIDHASLTLPITLEAACVDVPCDVESSCRSGVCVSSAAVCSEASGTCPSVAEPVLAQDGGSTPPPDGSVIEPDGGTLVDGSLDSPVDPGDAEPLTDAKLDGPNPNPGLCPTDKGPEDCYLSNMGTTALCCQDMQQGFICTAEVGCAGLYPRYYCTGPEHCGAGGTCCGGIATPDGGGGSDGGGSDSGPGADSGSVDGGSLAFSAKCIAAGASCTGTQSIICGSDADCPIDRPSCTRVSGTVHNRTIYACQ